MSKIEAPKPAVTSPNRLTLRKETVQHLHVTSSVKTGRAGGTGWTSQGGTCDRNCNYTGIVCNGGAAI